MALMTRFDGWVRRVHFPGPNAKVGLGVGYEFYLLDPARYQGHAELKAKAKAVGRKWGKRDLAYRLVERMLDDVVVAAGGR